MTDPIEAYVQIGVLSAMEEDVLSGVLEIEGVKKASIVFGGSFGDGSVLAEVYGNDMNNYTKIVREIRQIRGVEDTLSSIIVSYVKK